MKHAKECDEVWHAGDWGDWNNFEDFESKHIVRGVYGNIDGILIRSVFPEDLSFKIEGLKVFMTHIGGYPSRYNARVKAQLQELKPDLYICGHSHICKIMRDKTLDLVHFNPGAIGQKGFHKKRTMMKFGIEDGKLIDIQILEYDRN